MARSQVLLTSAQWAEKWKTRAGAAVSDAVAGVGRVTVAPTEQAAQAKQKMLTNLTAAVNSGKWEAGLRKVDLASWKDTTTKKMNERMASGINAAQGKMQAFADYLIPTVNQNMAVIHAMPSMTLQDNINRMVKNVQLMAEKPYKK